MSTAEARAADDQWFRETMAKSARAMEVLQNLKAASRDEQLGIAVTVNYSGELTRVDIETAALRNSLESISRAIVANFDIARLQMGEGVAKVASSVFPGDAALVEAQGVYDRLGQIARLKQRRSSTWKTAAEPAYDEDEGWRRPFLRS